MLTYDIILNNFVAWAEDEPGLRGALMIGSRARTDHPADEWSDLDLLLFVEEPERYAFHTDWVESLGPIWLTFIERTPDGKTWERRTMFAGGLDVDFALNKVEDLKYLASHDLPPDAMDVLRRGARAVVDKDGLLALVLNKPLPEVQLTPLPSESEYLNLVHDFWYHTIWSSKHLRRGEIWWAKSCVDEYMKNRLRKMLEWQAQATRGAQHDTWMRGRFLEEWADPRAVTELLDVYAHYDPEDIARALLKTMGLFRWLARETAKMRGFSYPTEGDRHATELVKILLTEMK